MTNIIGAAFIAGTAVTATEGFYATNPNTNEQLPGLFPENGPNDVKKATSAARTAFQEYRKLPDSDKAHFLTSIAAELEIDREAIVHRATQESALPDMRINGELSRTTGQLNLFAQLLHEGSWVRAIIDQADPTRQPLPKPDLRMMLQPLGPVAVFGASNFPLAFSVAGGDTASALAAGCPVIVKGHPAHPGTSELVANAINRAIKKCNLPAGVFSLLQGTSTALGGALVADSNIKAVGFTGSLKGGRALFDLATGRPEPIPFYGELGSTNPVYLLPDALEQKADTLASEFVGSLNMGCGQFCTNPGLLISCTSEALDQFIKTAVEGIQKSIAAPMLTSGICKAYHENKDHLARQSGITQLGTGMDATENQAQASLFSVSAETFMNNAVFEEEVFGPTALIVICDNSEQMLDVTRHLSGHLTSTLHATEKDQPLAALINQEISQKVGRVLFNGWPTGVEVAHGMTHGGPYPASTDSRSTSVGSTAIDRWVRPISWQNAPDALLPPTLQNNNPFGIWRKVNGNFTQKAL